MGAEGTAGAALSGGAGGVSGAGVGRRVTETSSPSGCPIRRPRSSRSLEPLRAGGVGGALGIGAVLGVGRGVGWGMGLGLLGGAASGGGSSSLTRSGLSKGTGVLATSSRRPKSPAWTKSETASDLLRTD
jgi:hypothetical protein